MSGPAGSDGGTTVELGSGAAIPGWTDLFEDEDEHDAVLDALAAARRRVLGITGLRAQLAANTRTSDTRTRARRDSGASADNASAEAEKQRARADAAEARRDASERAVKGGVAQLRKAQAQVRELRARLKQQQREAGEREAASAAEVERLGDEVRASREEAAAAQADVATCLRLLETLTAGGVTTASLAKQVGRWARASA